MNTAGGNIAYLGLGSNVGDRERNLLQALQNLDNREDTSVAAVSKVYETDPVGYLEQPAFLNMACRIDTSLSPFGLLEATLAVEQRLGRERSVRWGPRSIDIDILLYNDLKLDTADLMLPHPRLLERPFVLIPLKDIMPNIEARLSLQHHLLDGNNGVKVWITTFKPEKFGRIEN